MRTRRTLTVSAIAAAVALGAGGVALADTSATSSSPSAPPPSGTAKSPAKDGSHALCRQAPRMEKKTARKLKRLQAGAGTRGSVARLDKRVDNARGAGHTAVQKALSDALARRQDDVKALQQRQTDLKGVASWCATQKPTKSGTASPSTSSAS